MSYARRVAYNTIIQVVGRIFTTVTSLVMVSVLNAGLGAHGWGSYVAVTTYAGFFAVLADMGINTLYLREISRYPEQEEEITAKFLGFRLVTGLALTILGPLVAFLLPVYSSLTLAITVVSIGQFLLLINQIFVSIVQRRLHMDRAILTDFLGRVVILGTVLAVFRWAPHAHQFILVLAAVILGSLVNVLLMFIFVRRLMRIRIIWNVQEWPQLLVRVLPMGALTVLGLIHFKADSVILTLLKTDVDVGIYGNAYKIVEVLLVLPAVFIGSLIPALNQEFMKREGQMAVLMQKAFDLLVFAVVPLVLFIFFFAAQIMGVLTRQNILPAAHSLQILVLAMIPWFLGSLMANALLAAEGQKQLSLIELGAALANIGLNLIFIPRYSYYGAAWTTVTTEFLTLCVTTWLVVRILSFFPQLMSGVRTLCASIPAALFIWVVSQKVGWLQLSHYASLGRPEQAALLVVTILLFGCFYLLPFYVLRWFPPVLQEKFRNGVTQ